MLTISFSKIPLILKLKTVKITLSNARKLSDWKYFYLILFLVILPVNPASFR
jgi:hypothetical protein